MKSRTERVAVRGKGQARVMYLTQTLQELSSMSDMAKYQNNLCILPYPPPK